MRISETERSQIKTIVGRFCPKAKVYLFGSRVDDGKKGGDIDLLIQPKSELTVETLLNLKITLKDALGDQKIDILTSLNPHSDPRPIVSIAIKTGIEL